VAGHALRDKIAAWSSEISSQIRWPELPPEIVDRDADVWESLIAIADAVGDEWPARARVSAVTLATESKEAEPSLGIRLLADIKQVFGDVDAMSSKSLLQALHALEESPWSDLRGKPLDERGLALRLRQYGLKSKTVRTEGSTIKGYARVNFVDTWARYVPSPSANSVTSVTSVTPSENPSLAEVGTGPSVTDVTAVTQFGDGRRRCAHCDQTGDLFCEASVGGKPVDLHMGCRDAFRP
jgi:hypothetical protein